MRILDMIMLNCYETPIKGNAEYDALCERRDEYEEKFAALDTKTRELFVEFSNFMDEFVCFYSDYSMEFAYTKIKEILKELNLKESEDI